MKLNQLFESVLREAENYDNCNVVIEYRISYLGNSEEKAMKSVVKWIERIEKKGLKAKFLKLEPECYYKTDIPTGYYHGWFIIEGNAKTLKNWLKSRSDEPYEVFDSMEAKQKSGSLKIISPENFKFTWKQEKDFGSEYWKRRNVNNPS